MNTSHKKSCRCAACRALRDAQRQLLKQWVEEAGFVWSDAPASTWEEYVRLFGQGIQPFGPKQRRVLETEPARWNTLVALAAQIVGGD